MKGHATRVILAGWLAVACAGACQGPAHPVVPGESAALRAALDAPTPAGPLAVQLRVPADGAVVPWVFAPVTFRWEDRFQGNAFRLRIRTRAQGVVLEAFPLERSFHPSPEAWDRVKAAVGEGGAFEVELTAASAGPDGTLRRGPVTVVSEARFSDPSERPSGHLLYNWVGRSPGATSRPVFEHGEFSVVPLRVSMDGVVEREMPELPDARRRWDDYLARSGGPEPAPPPGKTLAGLSPESTLTWRAGSVATTRPGDATAARTADRSGVARTPGTPTWSKGAEGRQRECSGCHAESSDGRWFALDTVDNSYPPKEFVHTGLLMVVARKADNALLYEVPGGALPRFNPRSPNLLVYALGGAETGNSRRSSIFGMDLHGLDVETGLDRPVPGAADPHRCETYPDWSPDGRTLVFARSHLGEPCDSSQGHLDLVTVPWNEGAGGPAAVVPGVSSDELSNCSPRYSPDGRWIVFFRTRGGCFARGSADLWRVPASGGEPVRLPVSTDAMESAHAFSPDGHWLAFVTNRERVDRMQVYVARFFEDGRVAPAVPFPTAGDDDVVGYAVDWVR